MVFKKERIDFQDIKIDDILYGKVYNNEYGFVEVINKTQLVIYLVAYVLESKNIRQFTLDIPQDMWNNPWMEWGYLAPSTRVKLAKKLLKFPIYESDARSIL
jgi:hypothetical protein